MPLLTVTDLTKRFVARRTVLGRPAAHVTAVDGVSFHVEAGETLALVGESGCGKSTVGRLVLNLIEPTGGRVRFDGADVVGLNAAEQKKLRTWAQLVFQDPYASLNPRMTVGETLDEPLMLHTDLPRSARAARVGELLDLVGLRPQHAERYPHEFSGGQRQRIAIARALAVTPKLIVCDEPVSALDVSIRAQVLNLLQDLQAKFGLALIFISHDLSVVRHVAHRVAVMYLGRIVETGPTEAVFSGARHPYTQALLSAIPLPTPRVGRTRRLLPGDPPSPLNPPTGCHLHGRCPHVRLPECAAMIPASELVAAGHAVSCHRWRDIGVDPAALPEDAPRSATLERLLAAYQP